MTPKKFLLIAAAGAAALLVAVVAAALFVDVDRFRPQLQQAISSAAGRPVEIGHVHLSALTGSLSVEDVSIGDDPAFGSKPFVKAKALKVGVDLLPLIMSRTLHVRSFTLQQPEVTLRRSAAGTWNFATLGASPSSSRAAAGGASDAGSSFAIAVDRLAIANGRVVVEERAGRTRSRTYDDVRFEVSDFSATSKFPFRFSAQSPGSGTMTLEGTAGPLSPAGVGATPFDARLAIKRLDLAGTGLIDPASGIAGIVNVDLHVVSDGRRMTSDGTLRGEKLQLMPGGAPAAVPVELAYRSEYDLTTHDGTVGRGDARVGAAAAKFGGAFNTKGEAPALQMKLSGARMPAADLEAVLPAIGISVPAGARFKTGTIDAELSFAGRVDRLVIAGPVKLSDARLAGFDLGSSMHGIGPLANAPSGSETVIQTLSANVRVAADGTRVDALTLIVPTIGDMKGDGTIAPAGALHFRMLAKLAHAGGDVARVASFGRPENGIAFRVEGTLAKPLFLPDIGRAVETLVKDPKSASQAVGLAGRIFGKRPKNQ